MSEKDRLGQKLRDKEKAEEDRYFAQADKEKMDALRSESEAPAQLGLCPKCGIALEQQTKQGVTIDVCPTCSGIWLDGGELEAIMEREDEGWLTRLIRSNLGSD